MESNALVAIGFFIASLILMALAGRSLILRGSNYGSPVHTPLFYYLTGLGLWHLMFLGSWYIGIASLTGMWWLFVAVSIILILTTRKTVVNTGEGEHFYTPTAFMILLMTPAFLNLRDTVIPTPAAMSDIFRPLQLMSLSGGVPSWLWQHQGVTLELSRTPLLSALLPATLFDGFDAEKASQLLTIFGLILVANALIKVTSTTVKWSNLALVSANALLATALTASLFSGSFWHSDPTPLLGGMLLLIAAAPLLQPNASFQGVSALGFGLVLGLLTLMSPYGMIPALSLAVLYTIQCAVTGITSRTAFSIIVAYGVPLLCYLLWQNVVLTGSLTLGERLATLTQLQTWDLISLTLSFFIIIAALVTRATPRNTSTAWLFHCAGLILLYHLGAVAVFGTPAPVQHLQFIVLVPLWRGFMQLYQHSTLQKITYKAPWAVGLTVSLLIITLQNISLPRHVNPSHASHIAQIADILTGQYFTAEDKIAIVDHTARQPATLIRMNYHLAMQHPAVVDGNLFITAADNNLATFHGKLKQTGINWLWLHAPNETLEALFSRPFIPTQSYLFQVEDRGFQLIHSAAHPSYR